MPDINSFVVTLAILLVPGYLATQVYRSLGRSTSDRVMRSWGDFLQILVFALVGQLSGLDGDYHGGTQWLKKNLSVALTRKFTSVQGLRLPGRRLIRPANGLTAARLLTRKPRIEIPADGGACPHSNHALVARYGMASRLANSRATWSRSWSRLPRLSMTTSA